MSSYYESLAMSFDFNHLADAQPEPSTSTATSSALPAASTPSQPARSTANVTVYQTTGPDAHTTPIMAPGGSGTPAINPRSCVTCRRRKVRCDKQMPCSNCRRAQIPCLFPAPGRAPRQPRPRDPNAPPKNSSQREQELMKRLRKLEGIVEDLSGQIEVESSGKGPSSASSPDAAHNPHAAERASTLPPRQPSNAPLFGCHGGSPLESDAVSENSEVARRKELHQKFGRLVLTEQPGGTQTGSQTGNRRYVSSGFWTKLNDELDSIRHETQKLTDDDSDESDYDGTPETSPSSAAPVDHHAFVFGYRSADVDLTKCHPLASHVPFLWLVFKENVEPLIKVLHVPTVDAIFSDARKNQASLTPAQEALVFTIYYAAVTSLEADEVQTNLGANKEDLLNQFRFAVEQALSKANFLHSSDLTLLQAFTIFLVVVRRQDDSRFCWSLIGLVVHLAQGMGLHRDGTHFGLSPYETEMRRRIWWQLLVLDLRSADELGADLIISDRDSDTNLPSNIDDADLTQEMTEFPEEKESRSDCAVALVRYEICSLSRRLVRASSAFANICPRGMTLTGASLPERERMLIDVYQGIESKFLKNVVLHETDPLYWLAAMIARIIMAKMCLVIYQPMLFPGSDGELSDEARQRVYVAAIEIMEYSYILATDQRCKQYRWLFMTYTNWHAMAYFLVESVERPWTPLVERGWKNLHHYSKVQFTKNDNHAAAMMPLKKLLHRVAKHRESEILRLKANPSDAYRLDFTERMNPTHARFGPVPGAEGRMESIREEWLQLVRPEGATPWPTPAPLTLAQQSQSPAEKKEEQSPQQFSAPETKPQPSPPRTPPSNSLPTNIELSDATMTMIDDLMSQDTTFPMTAFWPMNDIVASEMKNSASNAAGVAPATSTASVPHMQSPPLGQQIPETAILPKDDNPPPYLWADPFTSMNSSFGDVGVEDTDMLGEEFNWQDWSQSIRGLEMESTQPPPKKW